MPHSLGFKKNITQPWMGKFIIYMFHSSLHYVLLEHKKNGQHSAMNGTLLVHMPFMAECHGKLEKNNWAAFSHEWHTFSLHAIHGWIQWEVGTKNWTALSHEWHAFNLWTCHSWLSAKESWEKKWNTDMTYLLLKISTCQPQLVQIKNVFGWVYIISRNYNNSHW